MIVLLQPEAISDVIELQEWYEESSTSLGLSFRTDLNQFKSRIEQFPSIFPHVPSSPRGREIRVGQLSIFPIVVHYEVLATRLVILSLTHAHRRSSPWRRRLP